MFPLHEAPDGRKYMLYRWRPTLVEEMLPEPMRPLPPADRLVMIRRNNLPPVSAALRSGRGLVFSGLSIDTHTHVFPLNLKGSTEGYTCF